LDFELPEEFKTTINGDEFGDVIRLDTSDDVILLFTTSQNIKLLSKAKTWLMGGTFKTTPRLFYQMFTIHGQIGSDDKKRIFPFVYALMKLKRQELYQKLFETIDQMVNEIDVILETDFIITDFELAAVNASAIIFTAQNKCCLFHLCQTIYRKIQGFGLKKKYDTNIYFSLLVRKIFALAFLPHHQIPFVFDELKTEFSNDELSK